MNYQNWKKQLANTHRNFKEFKEEYQDKWDYKLEIEYNCIFDLKIEQDKVEFLGIEYRSLAKEILKLQCLISKQLGRLKKAKVLTKAEFEDWRYRYGFKVED